MTALAQIITEHAQIAKDHPNAIGEILRAWAFPGEGYGCYSNFDMRPEFVQVDVTPREFAFLFAREFNANDKDNDWGWSDGEAIKDMRWFKHPSGIEMGWHWDGDGILAFYSQELEDEYCNGVVRNDDCKKDYEWRFGEREEET